MMMMMNRSSNRLLYHKRQQSTNNDKKIMIKKKKTTKNHKKQKVKCIQYIIVSLFAGFFILYLQSFKRIFIQITETKKMKMNDGKDINEKTKKIISSSLYNPSKIMFLNTTNNDACILRDYQPIVNDKNNKKGEGGGNYEIDILTIGSISSINRAKVQMKTWGSHISRRHYWLATELDDPDPTCYTSMSLDDVTTYSHTCSKNARKYWESHGSWNYLTSYLKNVFAQPQWLLEKKNPQGWICAQKRFLFALSKLLALYRDGRDQYGVDLPDYLIFGDDDTYVNLEMIEDELLRTPNVIVKEKGYTMDDELHMVYPTQNTPVVWAGCRVRRPTNIIHDTFPFGGFGVMISKGAIERLIQPLNCNNNEVKVGFEAEACDHWTPPYANWSIAEYQYFKPGMSVSDLMGSYVKNMQPFCLHSGKSLFFRRAI